MSKTYMAVLSLGNVVVVIVVVVIVVVFYSA